MELNTIYSKDLVEEILSSGEIQDASGRIIKLNSNIDRTEGQFLEQIIKANGFSKTIEVGCAYGISSLFICGSISEPDSLHTIIDPFQTSDWGSIGITQLQRANLKNFTLIEERSEIALPKLLEQGKQFDFAFIDGWHTFDHTLLDMFYMNRLLRKGGIMVIDDVGMPAVERAVNYFLNYPAYQFEDGVRLNELTKSRTFFNNYVVNPISKITKILPQKVREEIFSNKVVGQGINGYSMVALRKIKDDERPWNWYMNF